MNNAKTLIFFVAIFASTVCAKPNNEQRPPTQDELAMMAKLCFEADDKESCQTLIKTSVLLPPQSCVASCNSIGEDNNCYKSCNNVGLIHLKAGDYTNAMQYAKQSINIGNPYPYSWLDILHYKSGNMEAIQILEKACNNTKSKEIQAASCTILAQIYLKGRGIFGAGKGVYQNYKNAYQYSKKACDMQVENSSHSCYMVGYLYTHGKGTRQDTSQAKEYLGKACDLGNQGACERYKQTQ